MRASKRIVVIDDDPDFVEYTRIILEAASYEFLTASNAAERFTSDSSASESSPTERVRA